MQKKLIRIYYYELECTKKDENGKIVRIDFDIDVFLRDIDALPLQERVVEYQGSYTRLENFYYPKESSSSLVALVFNRMSDFNTLRKSKLNERSESIPLKDNEYIDKACSIVYNLDLKILAIQNNKGALTARGVEHYLSQKYGDGKYEFKLSPVVSPNVIEAIKKQKLFRKVVIKLNHIGRYTELAKGTTSTILFNTFESCQASHSPVGVLQLSMEHNRKDNLDVDSTLELVSDLERNKDLVDKADFYMRKNESDDEETTVLNFLQINLSDVIKLEVVPREPVSYKSVIKEMVDKMKMREEYLRSLRK